MNGAEVLSDPGPRLESIDMARLLGRTPSDQARTSFFSRQDIAVTKDSEEKDDAATNEGRAWRGSGLGSDWDEKVGAGAAAASIVSVAQC